MAGLSEFAKTYTAGRPGPQCWTCSIPEAKEVNQGWKDGVSIRAIRAWLVEKKGYKPSIATLAKLNSHFHSGRHHEQ